MLNAIKIYLLFLYGKVTKTEISIPEPQIQPPKPPKEIEEYTNLILQLQSMGYIRRKDLDKKLKELSWTYVSYGRYSVVYLTPCKQYILRIGKLGDNAYTSHAYNAIRYFNNPYYCNIYALVFGLQSKLSFTFMERLEKIDEYDSLHEPYNRLSKVVSKMSCGKHALHKTNGKDKLDLALSNIAQLLIIQKFGFDLYPHFGNAMARNGRELVLTDPLV